MRETKSVTIDGFQYQIAQLGAKLGKKVLAHLMRVIGPAFEASDPVAKFASTFTDDEFDYLCDTFVATTQFSAEDSPDKVFLLKDHFDSHFANRYGAMMKWLWACVDANFGTFLGELGLTPEVREQMLTAVKTEMFSPKTAPITPSGAASPPATGG
jgi:hypothetical protein